MSNLILLASIVIPAILAICGLIVWRLVRSLDKRRSPLNTQLLNLPGEGLRKRMAKHEDSFSESIALVVALGPIFLAAWLLIRMERAGVDWSAVRFGTGDLFLLMVAIFMVACVLWRMIHHARQLQSSKQGLRAELAVAQSLTPLIADGAMVFHDFPMDKGNIDHVVVARSVVFAVETKSRKKPAQKRKESATVRYDSQQLFFPHHTERKPLEQAKFQADWLAKFLRQAGAEPVRVVPVLALPGWYIDRTNRDVRADVLVSNCTNSSFMMHENFGAPMPESLRKHIAHVLTQRYPPLEID